MANSTGLQFTVTIGALPESTFSVVDFQLDEGLNQPFALGLSLASALPGAHSDIGGGYYSRWSLSDPNSDPALTECIELERFMSEEDALVPDTGSHAPARGDRFGPLFVYPTQW
ncbi:hypothetical protein [Lonsdalea populi]|uniref:hypothetical protein n=1 Tax=Lonsdalea populi TaxID=1172565 RepID=UPI000A252E8A|nr:hypothetical protein [Lonsdalea populi]OSM98892.1 hypothetical protein AU508_01840 [Lonsdalea populi]RAT70230.1 hypothetical protein AU504_08580 [Lonsdalea populi]RAT72932.1 hypothetical protein AU505_05875 [Lonsdalea populi]RAT76518.1 hypothetical protein AU506_05580 [Lonsdalea populi]RAT77645.1 hypothetical protein AU507_11490 [Lonsdalea populi]